MLDTNRHIVLFAGLFCLLLTTPVFPLAPRLLDRAVQGENVGAFTIAAGLTAIVFALVIIVYSANGAHQLLFSFKHSLVLCCLYFFAFIAGFWLMPLFGNQILASAFGVFLGVGISGVCIVWSTCIAAIAPHIKSFGAILAMLCLVTLCAVLANVALVLVPQGIVLGVLVVACAVSAFMPLALLKTSTDTELLLGEDKATFAELITMILGAEDVSLNTKAPDESANTAFASNPLFILQVLLPFSILLLYAASQLITHFIEGHHELVTWSILAGPILAAVPLLARTDSSRTTVALHAALPLFGIIVLGAAVLVPDTNEASVIALGAQALCYAYGITFIALAGYFSIARRPSALVPMAALGVIVLSLVMMLPYFTFPAISETAIPIYVAILVAVLCLLAASASFSTWNSAFTLAYAARKRTEDTATNTATLEDKVHAACDALADEYALSPREREILYYLGRGYGPRYLAGILPIKENTIRSHVRNIYTKTDVHTQADLLMLIDSHARY